VCAGSLAFDPVESELAIGRGALGRESESIAQPVEYGVATK
jgi:hypothetical protein